MKRQSLVAKAARKFKCTTDSKHRLPVAPNLPEQDFNAIAPNQKWAGDITYLAPSDFEYIEVDYNRTRRRSALGYLSPVNFEKQTVA